MPDMQSPADLTGTLNGMDVLSLLQAFQQTQGKELAQKTAAATQQAQAAQQAYSGAAAQPPPQLTPGDTFIPGLLGGVASILSGNPTYQQAAEKSAVQKQADLLKARADNLQALRDVYSQKADEAQKAGNLEDTEKYRTKLETLNKTYDLVNANADRAARAHQAELDRQSAERIAADKGNDKTAKLDLTAINTVNDNIRQDQELKDYAVVRDQYTTGVDAAKDQTSAGDIILMRALARASDPRTGVREGEYRTFQGAAGTLPRLGVRLTSQMVGKGQLTTAGRNALLRRLKAIESRKKIQADRRLTVFKNQAKKLGVPEDLVISDISAGDSVATPSTNDPLGVR